MRRKFMCVGVLLILGVMGVFFYFNISLEYPLGGVCNQVRKFNSDYGRLPDMREFESLNIPKIGRLSILRYKNKKNDFELYFCPTVLGPCEVCSENNGPSPEEI